MDPAARRHIRLESGPLRLDFQGCADQIARVAAQLADFGFAITIDDHIAPDLPHLPCGRLWD